MTWVIADGAGGGMIRKSTEAKIAEAYKLLRKHGILCHVPGCYDITSPENAVLYAKDRKRFYKKMEE